MNYKLLNKVYYFSLIATIIIFVLPIDFKVEGYSLSLLGWFWLIVAIPSTLITFFWILILDLSRKNKKPIFKRILIFLLMIGMAVIYWFYASGCDGYL